MKLVTKDSELMSPVLAKMVVSGEMARRARCVLSSEAMSVIASEVQPAFAKARAVAAPIPGLLAWKWFVLRTYLLLRR